VRCERDWGELVERIERVAELVDWERPVREDN